MTADTDATPPPRKPDWVLATLAGLAVASVLATAFFWNAWAPDEPDEAKVAEWRQRSLAACRAHPDLLAHLAIAAVPYDELRLSTTQCVGDCPQYRLRIHQDGRAELAVSEPADQRGDFSMRIPPAEFTRLATLAATLEFERRGSLDPLPPPEGGTVMEARRDKRRSFLANATSVPGEYPALVACMRSLQSDQRWIRDTSEDAIIVD
jgi:hypothetical protein